MIFKKCLVFAVLVLSLVGVFGCTSGADRPASVKSIRDAAVGPQWQMKQVEINFTNETFMTLELAAGDKVDGYYYLLDGAGVSFAISGTSDIYASKSGTTADRFSFTAMQGQGIDYKLKFNVTGGDNPEATVFLEIIYPITGKVLVPFGTK
jgi:hypothetical protein